MSEIEEKNKSSFRFLSFLAFSDLDSFCTVFCVLCKGRERKRKEASLTLNMALLFTYTFPDLASNFVRRMGETVKLAGKYGEREGEREVREKVLRESGM